MGALLDETTIQQLVLCAQHNLVLLAYKVYQANLHARATHLFTSFKKVVRDLGSFHSISKGVTGECGRRSGYFECANIDRGCQAISDSIVLGPCREGTNVDGVLHTRQSMLA